jgi:hypothetical protein
VRQCASPSARTGLKPWSGRPTAARRAPRIVSTASSEAPRRRRPRRAVRFLGELSRRLLPTGELPSCLRSLGFVPRRVPNPFSSSLQDLRSSPLFSPTEQRTGRRTPHRSPEPGPRAGLQELEPRAAAGPCLLEQPAVAEPTRLDVATVRFQASPVRAELVVRRAALASSGARHRAKHRRSAAWTCHRLRRASLYQAADTSAVSLPRRGPPCSRLLRRSQAPAISNAEPGPCLHVNHAAGRDPAFHLSFAAATRRSARRCRSPRARPVLCAALATNELSHAVKNRNSDTLVHSCILKFHIK